MRPLGDGRLFVNDQRGLIYRVEKGVATQYLNVRPLLPAFIDQPGLGTGLHSFAFHPEFMANGRLYTVHSEPWNAGTPDFKGPVAPVNSGGQMSVVSEWTTLDPAAASFNGTRRELFRVYFPGTIHCAQEIAFNPNAGPGDPDYGLLYICLGEGGSYLRGYWQNEHRLDSPMGTIFRIDPLGNNSANGNYGIPADNPWADSGDPSVIREIFAYGFRNPHRIVWDTGGSGRVYVGDIGETQVEELNLLEPGLDYGFPQREGTFRLDPTKPSDNESVYPLPPDDASFGFTYPVAQYDHDEGRAIAAGPVYRGTLAPELTGKVLFGDIPLGRIFLVDESALSFGAQADLKEARLRLNGVEGTLTSFVGNSRADLRWGMDGDGEVFVMTKTDGKIRRIIGTATGDDSFRNEPGRWLAVHDADTVQATYLVRATGSGGTVRAQPDPFGDAANRVLALRAAGTLISFPVPAFPTGERGSLYFRFALEDEASVAEFAAAPIAFLLFSAVQGTLAGDGTVTVNNGTGAVSAAGRLRPGVWYEAWIVFTSATSFNFYISGDRATAPTLAGAGLLPKRSVGSGLTQFLWGVPDGSGDTATIYLDDLHADPSASNLSQPTGPRWALVANFESPARLADWQLIQQAGGQLIAAAAPQAAVFTEPSGNRSLRISASPIAGTHIHALAPLPARIEVSDSVTFYARCRISDFSTNQVWGLVNVPETEILPLRYDAFDVMGRWSNEAGSDQLLIRDDTAYLPASGSYAAGLWYEVWMVVRNGGEASGGQTFDVYARPDGLDSPPALVYSNAGFRLARETPIDFFQIIANNGALGKTSPVLYDDLFLVEGIRLESPQGTGYGLYPGAPGWKTIPWLGWVNDQAFPWIYHPAHGWLYAATNRPEGAWHFDPGLGWLFLAPSLYPFIYDATASRWLFYTQTSVATRWLYDYSADIWFSVPAP